MECVEFKRGSVRRQCGETYREKVQYMRSVRKGSILFWVASVVLPPRREILAWFVETSFEGRMKVLE